MGFANSFIKILPNFPCIMMNKDPKWVFVNSDGNDDGESKRINGESVAILWTVSFLLHNVFFWSISYHKTILRKCRGESGESTKNSPSLLKREFFKTVEANFSRYFPSSCVVLPCSRMKGKVKVHYVYGQGVQKILEKVSYSMIQVDRESW